MEEDYTTKTADRMHRTVLPGVIPQDGQIHKQSLLILDKVFVSPRMDTLRGVEVFNVNFMKDLVGAGYSLTVPVHHTWQETLYREFGGSVETVSSTVGGAVFGGIMLALSLRKRKFSALLLTNVANRLIPMIRIFRFFNVAPYCTLIAHREPSKRSLDAQKCWPSRIVAVNEKIADHFRKAGFSSVAVYYGITQADRFHPPAEKADKDTVDFCILGHLDSAWKGSDTAIAAFRQLDEEARKVCRLHLASFCNPPVVEDDNIILYDWMSSDKIADFLRRMDIMLVPSRDEEVMRETFSQAIVQGMLTGLPCIVNNLPILTCKLDAGGGLVFDTVKDLRDHITDLALNKAKRCEMGMQARETALTRYVWDTNIFIERFLQPSSTQ